MNELRFRKTALGDATDDTLAGQIGCSADLWTPVFQGRLSAHCFLGYYEARPALADAKIAAESGRYTTGHEVVGYAKITITVKDTVTLGGPRLRDDPQVCSTCGTAHLVDDDCPSDPEVQALVDAMAEDAAGPSDLQQV